MITIKYDTPIEVTDKQYQKLMTKFSGVVAGNEEGGKFFIKVWLMAYAGDVRKLLMS